MGSRRATLVSLIKLLDELNITREESLTPDLNLQFDPNTNSFSWNQKISLDKTISFDETIYNEITSELGFLSSSEGRDLYVKFVQNNT